METDDIIDISPNRAHGRLINLPIRAVRGSNWTGDELDFNHAPDQYAAIHFLDDSLYDCEWKADFELDSPRRHAERPLRRPPHGRRPGGPHHLRRATAARPRLGLSGPDHPHGQLHGLRPTLEAASSSGMSCSPTTSP